MTSPPDFRAMAEDIVADFPPYRPKAWEALVEAALRFGYQLGEEAMRERAEEGLNERADQHDQIARERPKARHGGPDDIAKEHRMIAVRSRQDAEFVRALPLTTTEPKP